MSNEQGWAQYNGEDDTWQYLISSLYSTAILKVWAVRIISNFSDSLMVSVALSQPPGTVLFEVLRRPRWDDSLRFLAISPILSSTIQWHLANWYPAVSTDLLSFHCQFDTTLSHLKRESQLSGTAQIRLVDQIASSRTGPKVTDKHCLEGKKKSYCLVILNVSLFYKLLTISCFLSH